MAAMRLASVALGVVAVAAQQPAEAPVTLRLYDCNVEYDVWETNWTPEWKDWCCKNRQRGCPSTSTTTETTSTATPTTVTTTTRTTTEATTTTEDSKVAVEHCNKQCLFDGASATCAARMQWAAKFGATKDNSEPCTAAHSLVLSQCDVCSQCELKFSGCAMGAAEKQQLEEETEEETTTMAPAKKAAAEQKDNHGSNRSEETREKAQKHEQHEKRNSPMQFRQKFELPAAMGSRASGVQGFLPGFVVAGFAAGAVLLAVLQRGMHRPRQQAGLSEQIFTVAEEQFDELE
eukprot:CAMPEP_0204244110 /NCGR_PEP_ID=MMETSP0361-20130328/96814_1 /ASSEMBLY_ACC=CAM_ASM_000343 /TAXON_ID=268821 /ORGANISM="Scrippsiella Hangoei, Strain SHTV-5" /LENGTH=289 /DNA_ID=CAMNT_0051217091 /DNA_START=39 /DNA_END=908 /DNA_ORIENTATION=+